MKGRGSVSIYGTYAPHPHEPPSNRSGPGENPMPHMHQAVLFAADSVNSIVVNPAGVIGPFESCTAIKQVPATSAPDPRDVPVGVIDAAELFRTTPTEKSQSLFATEVTANVWFPPVVEPEFEP